MRLRGTPEKALSMIKACFGEVAKRELKRAVGELLPGEGFIICDTPYEAERVRSVIKLFGWVAKTTKTREGWKAWRVA